VIAPNAASVIATDLSDEMLEVARGRLKAFQNVIIEKADCEGVTLPAAAFDTVFMANVVHFIARPAEALVESYRVLKYGGLLLLVDYTGFGMTWLDRMRLGIRFVAACGMPPRHGRPSLSPDEFTALVEDAGFTLQDLDLIGEQTKALCLKARKR
jgi:ubiquinone/menaquinone biosynthesis C-methylase UbiE